MNKAVSPNYPANSNALVSADYEKSSPLEKYPKIRALNDPRLGEISLLQTPHNKEIIAARELKFTDLKSLGNAILEARSRIQFAHPHLLPLMDYSTAKQSAICSTIHILKLFYEYPKSDLKRESLERQRRGEKFSGEELKGIFLQTTSVLDHIHSQGRFHGDLQPLLLGYDKEQDVVKLIDKPELNSVAAIRNQQKQRFVNGLPLYIGPQSYIALTSSNFDNAVDPETEDSYALGLIVLELGNNRSIQDIYDKKGKNIHQPNLQLHLQDFADQYGGSHPDLLQAIIDLTHLDHRNRKTSKQLTQVFIQGNHSHTQVRTKVEALPMDGVNLYDGINKNGSNKGFIERKVQRPVETAKVFSLAPSDDNQSRIVNLDEVHGQNPSQNGYIEYNSQGSYQPQGYSYVNYKNGGSLQNGVRHQNNSVYVSSAPPGDYENEQHAFVAPAVV